MIQVLSQQWQRIHPARQLKNVTNALLFLKSEKKKIRVLSSSVFTARCYASAVLAMALCLSVCPSVRSFVRHKSVFY